MRGHFPETFVLALPALLLGTLAWLLAWPPALSLPLVFLAAFLPPFLQLRSARNALKEQTVRNREFMQRLIDVIPQPVYVKDARAHYLMLNKAFVEERGQRMEDLLGTCSYQLAIDQTTAQSSQDEDQAVLAGQPVRVEVQDAHPASGNRRWRLIMKGSCLNADGEAVIVGANFDVTPWRQAEAELQEAVRREHAQHDELLAYLQRLLDVIPYPVYVKDAHSRYLLVNEAFARDKHRSASALIGHTGLRDDASAEVLRRHFAEDHAVLNGQIVLKEEQAHHANTGEEIFRIIAKARCIDTRGETVIVGAHVYITELRQAERRLQEALDREITLRQRTEDFVQRLIDVIPDPVYVKNEHSRYLLVNEAFAEYHHLSREHILSPDYPAFGPNTPRRAQSLREDTLVLNGQEVLKEEQVVRKATGEEVFRIVRKRRSLYLDGSPVIIGIDHNVTRWRLAERELQHLAQEDALTGLANRRHFQNEAARAIDLAQRYQAPLSLLLVDLDHFKQINDLYGHHCGDQVLIEAVRRIREGLRRADFPGRWGGEEFIILLPHTDLAEASLVAERLRSALADAPLQLAGRELSVTLSAGLAQRQIGESLETFIARADAALYAAKKAGRNQISVASTNNTPTPLA